MAAVRNVGQRLESISRQGNPSSFCLSYRDDDRAIGKGLAGLLISCKILKISIVEVVGKVQEMCSGRDACSTQVVKVQLR